MTSLPVHHSAKILAVILDPFCDRPPILYFFHNLLIARSSSSVFVSYSFYNKYTFGGLTQVY